MSDYYSVLGLQKGASVEEIKKAYKKLAKQYHPDISKDPDAEKKFKEIVEAYQVLSDSEKKQNYDNYGDAYKNFQGYQQGFGPGMDFDFEDIAAGVLPRRVQRRLRDFSAVFPHVQHLKRVKADGRVVPLGARFRGSLQHPLAAGNAVQAVRVLFVSLGLLGLCGLGH